MLKSVEDLQLTDDDVFDISIIKRDFSKMCRQQRANINDSDKNFDFLCGKNNNYD